MEASDDEPGPSRLDVPLALPGGHRRVPAYPPICNNVAYLPSQRRVPGLAGIVPTAKRRSFVMPQYFSLPKSRRVAGEQVDLAELRYVNEGTYRLNGVPEYADSRSPSPVGVGVNESEPPPSPSSSDEDVDAEVPQEEQQGRFHLDVKAFSEAMVILQSDYRASDSLMDAMLKKMDEYFPYYHPPCSLYRVYKQLDMISPYVKELQYICESCGGLLAAGSKICQAKGCGKKQHALNCATVKLDLRRQLQRVVAATGIQMLGYFRSRYHETPLMDFVGSPYYEKLVAEAQCDESKELCISLVAHIDSAPLQESTTLSITPIQLVVAELPPALRWCFRNMILPCYSITAKTKEVDYHALWSHVADEVAAVNGLQLAIDGRETVLKVHLAFVAADLLAKAKLISLRQFNGYYSCWYCLLKGEHCNGRHLYRVPELGEPRTADHFDSEYKEATRTKVATKFGIMNGSPSFPEALQKLLPFSVPADTLHACYLGVVFHLLEEIMANKNHLIDHTRRKQVETLIRQTVLWPTFIHRIFRSLEDLARMKASQLQYFSLLLPAFRGCIAPAALHILCALHAALCLLDADRISEDEIEKACELLKAFYVAVKDVFDEKLLGSNFHILLHLPEQVRQMGPLWAASTYAFEGHLFTLAGLKSDRANRGFANTIAERFSVKAQTSHGPTKSKDMKLRAGCVARGKQSVVQLSAPEIAALHKVGIQCPPYRAVSQVQTSTVIYKGGLAGGDSAVFFKKEGEKAFTFGKISKLILYAKRCFALVAIVPTTGHYLAKYMGDAPRALEDCFDAELYGKEFLECDDGAVPEFLAVECRQLLGHCMFVKDCDGKMFVSRLPRHAVHD